ncbi:MAG: hypothetical protein HYZ45_06750 [Burkholderiales bacterium]|nr:hypothetical protein [Burkholderiales bacterium]
MSEQAFALDSADDGRSFGVSWAAVFAGAAAAAALSFILLLLGVGLGLSSISPYTYNAMPVSVVTVGWIAFMQLAASGVGGYIAGRLRMKWTNVHDDEVYFRDTAHGLLAWAVTTLVMVALLASGIKTMLGGAFTAGSVVAAGAVAGSMVDSNAENRTGYFSDMLLRSATSDGGSSDLQRTEVGKIVTSSLAEGRLTADDRAYLTQTVIKRTGLSQLDAERRVDDIYGRAVKAAADAKEKAMQLADETRKAAAHSALWMFVTLLFGAFIASLAATLGGRRRDDVRIHLRPNVSPKSM